MNTQPPTASAASSAAPTEPPDSASAPSVSPSSDEVLRAEGEQQRQPDPDRRDDLGGDPEPDRPAEHVRRRTRPTARARPRRAPCPVTHDRVRASASTPSSASSPRRAEVGDRRVRDGVRADRHPAAEPPVRAARSAGGSTGTRRRRSGTPTPARSRRRAAGTGRRARPAAPRPTPGPPRRSRRARPRTARRPGRSPAKPIATLSKKRSRRASSCG